MNDEELGRIVRVLASHTQEQQRQTTESMEDIEDKISDVIRYLRFIDVQKSRDAATALEAYVEWRRNAGPAPHVLGEEKRPR